MPEFESFGDFILKKFKTQKKAASALGTTQPVISQWISGERGVSDKRKKEFEEMGFHGPWPSETRNSGDTVSEPSPAYGVPHVRDYNPGPYARAAWGIIRQAAVNIGADLTAPAVEEEIGDMFETFSNAFAQNPAEEVKLRLLRMAERVFQATKK